MSDQGTLPIPYTVKRKAGKFALQILLIGHTKLEPIDLLGPIQVVNLTWYQILSKQKDFHFN